MPQSKFEKTVPDWPKVQAEVNRRLDSDYPINYLQNIWRGLQKSERVMKELVSLLGEPEARAHE